MFPLFLQEEDFTGFGITAVRPENMSGAVPQSLSLSQTRSPRSSDHSPETKPLIGKIIPRTSKSTLIGKIVPRTPKEGQGARENQIENEEIPTMVIKLHDKQTALTARARRTVEQASGRRRRRKSIDFIRKAGEMADSGNSRNQTATTSTGGTRRNKLVSTVTAVKGTEKASKVKEPGEMLEDSDTDQSRPQSSVRHTKSFRFGHTRRASQAVTLSFTSSHKRQRKRMGKGMGASPEAGAEAGALSGEEAAMPLECKAESSQQKRPKKRPQHRTLYGHRRKAKLDVTRPIRRRNRTRRVFYTYVVESIPGTPTQDEQQLQGQQVAPAEGVPISLSEAQQTSNSSSAPLMSARSSRIIKTPKRFLDEEMISFPKGKLSVWVKNQQKEDGKASASPHESGYDDKSLHSNSNTSSALDSPSAVTRSPSKASPGVSRLVEIYKNLKKLTLKMAEKNQGKGDAQGDCTQQDDGVTSHVRKRKRSKIMMEEMESPGVVRKLAVVVPSNMPLGAAGNNSKDSIFFILVKYS